MMPALVVVAKNLKIAMEKMLNLSTTILKMPELISGIFVILPLKANE